MKTPDHRDLPGAAFDAAWALGTDPAGVLLVRVEERLQETSAGALQRCASTVCRLPAGILLVLIRIYQRTLSQALPAVLGPGCGCRFYPSCSQYAADALKTHGFWRGVFLSARRLLRCTPLHPGGFDPVPAKRMRIPSCRRYAGEQVSG